MNKNTIVLIGTLTLSSCSIATDALKSVLTDDKGVSVDAQVGSNESKVKTGIGKIDLARKTSTSIEDNEGNVDVRNSDGKYHIESTKDVYVTVTETNDLVYYLMGFFFVISLVREFFNWRKNRVK